jgi:hypothetical protein
MPAIMAVTFVASWIFTEKVPVTVMVTFLPLGRKG